MVSVAEHLLRKRSIFLLGVIFVISFGFFNPSVLSLNTKPETLTGAIPLLHNNDNNDINNIKEDDNNFDLYSTTVIILLLSLTTLVAINASKLKPVALFFYSCFIKPTGSADSHQAKLESFYKTQAGVYDSTRKNLLRGRDTMLRLTSAQLKTRLAKQQQQQPASTNQQQPNKDHKPVVWVDMGGGTGYNVERMNEYIPISTFDKVYVVDLCPSLLEVARERFQRLGWDNVEVVCEDAGKFRVPSELGGSASLVTFSYSLSMIDNIYPVVDHVSNTLLKPQHHQQQHHQQHNDLEGILGVVDFYASGKTTAKTLDRMSSTVTSRDGYSRQLSWLSRWFWSVWFETDSVYLHHSRRDYLEHIFHTIHCYNGRNTSFVPLVSIPYYVWVGCPHVSTSVPTAHSSTPLPTSVPQNTIAVRSPQPIKREIIIADRHDNNKSDIVHNIHKTADSAKANAHHEEGVTAPILKKLVAPNILDSHAAVRPLTPVTDLSLEMGKQQIIVTRAATLDQQQQDKNNGNNNEVKKWKRSNVGSAVAKPWRQSFDPACLTKFTNYIYAFAWEDPREDLKAMDIQPDDNILVITSGGCNVLEYALQGPRRIHAVDINPCQNHILELKCAAISSLEFEDFWKMFGDGIHQDFPSILDKDISPYLTEHCYNFWKNRTSHFTDTQYYFSGWSGLSLRILTGICKFCGIEKDVEEMTHTTDMKLQCEIWANKVRPVVLNSKFFKLLNNPIFLWYSWGVPMAQMQLVYNDKVTPYEYIWNTLDPLAFKYPFISEQYFYYLALNGKFAPSSCPTYLTRPAFEALKTESKLDCIRIHTDAINDVYAKIASGRINEDNNEDHCHTNIEDEMLTKVVLMDHLDWFGEDDARQEISSLCRVLKKGGRAFWRSAAYEPWYNKLFETYGFKVEPVGVRKPGEVIDRVNMYASFYVGTKMV
jgi:betaine lipid synthase